MKKLLQDKIERTSMLPLNDAEIETLNSRKNNQLFISIVTYIIIILTCYLLWKNTGSSSNLDDKSFRINFSNSETESFQKAIPYILGSILLITSCFFIKFIRLTIIPLSNDIRDRVKLQLFFVPTKSFKKINGIYYLALPFLKSQQIELNSKEYENIGHKEELCLEITPNALHFISLYKEDKLIKKF